MIYRGLFGIVKICFRNLKQYVWILFIVFFKGCFCVFQCLKLVMYIFGQNWNRYYFIFVVCYFLIVRFFLKLFICCQCIVGLGYICIVFFWIKDSLLLIQRLVFRGFRRLEVDFCKCCVKDWRLIISVWLLWSDSFYLEFVFVR